MQLRDVSLASNLKANSPFDSRLRFSMRPNRENLPFALAPITQQGRLHLPFNVSPYIRGLASSTSISIANSPASGLHVNA
jgi:hypothetical protein